MDFGRAFGYVFDDDEWPKKILIGGAISLIPLLGGFIVYGYMVEIVRRVFDVPDTNRLPEWDDIGGYLSRGLLFWLGLALWALPFILLFTCAFLVFVLSGVATGEEAIIGVTFALFYCAFIPSILFFSIISAIVIPVLLGRFAIEGRFGSMFEFDAILADVRRIGGVPLLLLAVTHLIAGYIGQLGVFLCLIGVVFTGFYGNLAIAHAAGQTYRLARGFEPARVGDREPIGY